MVCSYFSCCVQSLYTIKYKSFALNSMGATDEYRASDVSYDNNKKDESRRIWARANLPIFPHLADTPLQLKDNRLFETLEHNATTPVHENDDRTNASLDTEAVTVRKFRPSLVVHILLLIHQIPV